MPDDITQSLAPWMQGNTADASSYGGLGQLGLNLLANSNTPGRFGSIFGKSALGAQQGALDTAKQRMGLAQNAIGLQQMQQMWPFIMAEAQRQMGQPQQQGGQQGGPDQTGQASFYPGISQMPQPGQGAPPSQDAPPAGGGMAGGIPGMGMANLGGLLSLARMNPQGMLDAAKLQMEYNPGLATQMAAAKNELAQDQLGMQQAWLSRDPQMFQAHYIKFMKDAGMLNVSANRGTVTTFGGITPQGLGLSNFDPESGTQTVGGVQAPIPGAVGTKQALAGAEAQGRATGETVELTDTKTGAKYMVPKSYVTGGGAPPRQPAAPQRAGTPPTAGAPAAAPSRMPGPVSAIGPGQSAIITANAQQAAEDNKGYKSDLESGKDMLTNTAELRRAASDFTPNGFAETRTKWLDMLNSFNLLSPQEQKELGSAQVGNKIAIQLQAAATKQLGSREAAQIFSIMGKSLPNLTMSADGLEKVSGYLDGIARYKIARAQAAQTRMNANDITGVNNVRGEFVTNTNPLYYILASTAPKQRQEIIQSMGDKAPAFLAQWNKAANAHWAPRPDEYAGSGS